MAKLFSIVMPSLNQANFIEESIRSVMDQTYPSIELIVADGGSTDGTLDILQNLGAEYPSIRVFSEPDNGPANALNGAFKRVRGELVGWMNSDDLYARDALARAAQAFAEHPDWLICYGNGDHIDGNGNVTGSYPTRKPDAGLEGFSTGCYICQPTLAFKNSLLKMIGPLDETQKTSFDYELWLRAFSLIPERIGFIDRVQAYSRLHEDCITMKMRRTVAIEGIRLGVRYLGSRNAHWASTYLEEISRELNQAEFEREARDFLNEISQDLDTADLDRIRQAVLNT